MSACAEQLAEARERRCGVSLRTFGGQCREQSRFSSPQIVGMSEATPGGRICLPDGALDHLGMKENRPGRNPVIMGARQCGGIETMWRRATFRQAGSGARSVLVMANTGEERGLLGAV